MFNSQGIVLGLLFHRDSLDSAIAVDDHISEADTGRIVNSSGQHLVERYWGSYIAIVRNSANSSFSVMRDPTATLACYYAKWAGAHVFFSDMGDLNRYVPMHFSVNWAHIARRLFSGMALARDCGLQEIEDVPGGEWVTISGQRTTRKVIWHPSRFCVADNIEDQHTALKELRRAVFGVVRGIQSQHSDILVRLSGGLDSSIVTSCLAQCGSSSRVTCLNFYIPSNAGDDLNAPISAGLNRENLAKFRRLIGSSDERAFARVVANKCGFQLCEKEKRERDIDFARIWKAPLAPRPSGYVFFMDEDDTEMEVADRARATACFTGEAGDTVFYCTFRAIGALDYAYLHPFGGRLFNYIGVTAKLSGESPARVFGKVLKYGYLRARLPLPIDPTSLPHLLKEEAAMYAASHLMRHPWLDVAPALCPGKRNHVMGVALSVPYYHLVYRRERIATSVHPLASQPVVETCLRIPTYVLLADGVSRGLARLAFRDALPPEVARRTVKGLPMAFRQRLVRANISFIRECLLDGLLVHQGLLDRRKLENYLTGDQPFLTVEPHRIMDYVECEAWLSQWNSGPLGPGTQAARACGGRATAHTELPWSDSGLRVH
ncbi:MAG TPA: asparagine synthase-related protein [Steroidobacteraceae bacterium]|nr:asparagine synthase-related protein [Steroidobacteraceae bacterium]